MILLLRLFAVISGAVGMAAAAHARQADHSGQGAGLESPPPVEYFALREAINNVALSPSGEHIAFMKIESRDGNPIIEVYETDRLGQNPVRIGADPSEITSFSWLNDDRLLVNFRNRFRDDIPDVNQGVYASRQGIVSRDGGPFLEIPEFTNVIGVFETDDEVALAEGRPGLRRRSDGTLSGGVGAPDLFLIDVENGSVARTLVSGIRYGNLRFDTQDRLRGGDTFDANTRELVVFTRDPDADEWREILRIDAESREGFAFAGFDPQDPMQAFVIANNGEDTTGFYEFDLRDGEFGELLFRSADSDILGPVFSSRRDAVRLIVGVAYLGEDGKPKIAYLTTEEADAERALRASINEVFPETQNTIVSRSRDDRYMVIFTQGPRDPGTYYLLMDGAQLVPLGLQYPLLTADMLSNVEFVRYEARDGRSIPAYLTIPDGEPPFPTIILPHGGPWVQEIINYDEWGQFLASRGYLVMQPQYRGSLGYGIDHWTSSFGEWGLAMQDDKDDGARWLVGQGLADPDRLAMFGWSYGGYAALVASLRDDQLYQCAIAGAPVSDPIRFRANFRGGGLSRIQFAQLEEGYAGLVPEDMTADVNIPIMLVHGDLDQRVLIRHSRAFVNGLEQNNKPHRFVILEGADHFFNTLFYEHQIELYNEISDFLSNDCGPGGL